MKIEITFEEIISIPNNMELGEYVRKKMIEQMEKNLTE